MLCTDPPLSLQQASSIGSILLWRLYGVFSRGWSLTSSSNSPDFPQHLKPGLNCSTFSPNKAFLLFDLSGAVLHSVSVIQVLVTQDTVFKPSSEKCCKCHLLSLSCSPNFCSFYILICSSPGSTKFSAPSPVLYFYLWRDSLFCLVITPQKPPIWSLPASVSFLVPSLFF